MIHSVNPNLYQTNISKNGYSQNGDNQINTAKINAQSPSFGYNDEPSQHPVKRLALTLVNDAFGFVGVNFLLWKIQDIVNGKLLVGKINKHYTKGIQDNNKLGQLAVEMADKHKLLGKISMAQGSDGTAYFDHAKNQVVVGKDSYSSLFHELGHAAIENNTKFMKKLQRGRNHYTWIALGLYTLIAQRPKNTYEDKAPGPIARVKNFLNKNDYVIPLLAFSPELITEFKASQYGLNFLKGKVKDGTIEKSLFSKIKKSYITCFSTYLFIPVSIILVDALRNSVNKKVRKYN